MKHVVVSILALLLCSRAALGAASVIDEINGRVDSIDRRIKDQDKTLPSIETSYDFKDVTEGAPPQFSFFFDGGTGRLVACRISVGHETWGRQFFYYFDDSEQIQKYLEVVPPGGSGPPPSRSAILYARDGTIVWRNFEGLPRQAPERIKALYHALSKAGKEFGWP